MQPNLCRRNALIGARPTCLAILALLAMATAAGATTTDLGLSPFQAQTAWVSPHRDMQNTDFVPFATARRYQIRWRAEQGNMTLWAPSMGPEGNLYVCTGRAGEPAVHAYDRDGNLLWESGVPVAGSDPNPAAAAQLPFVDVDGDLYLTDTDHFWAFHADGSLKWVTPLPEPGAFIGAPVLTSSGLIGGVTKGGKLLFYDRATGTQAVATFDLPGGPAPAGTAAPAGLWAGGELDPAFIDIFWAGFNGFDLEVANTPAIHPDMDRLYITATSSATNMEGALYALDLLDGQWQIAFESPLGVNSGTSPALSPDGKQVYAVGGDNELATYDALSGARLWTAANISALASPQVGPDGTVYSGSPNGAEIVALYPDGSEKFRRNYDALARELLASQPVFGNILTDGQPVARADSVITVTGNNLKVVLKLGYDFQAPGRPVNTVPISVVLATLCPIDGQLLDWVELPDDSRGLISVAPDGTLFTSHAAAFTSIFYYFANAFVPPGAQVTSPPVAGITALEPVSFLEQTIAGLLWAKDLTNSAISGLSEIQDSAESLRELGRAGVQLLASAGSFADAQARLEIDAASASARSASTLAAEAHVTTAKALLSTVPLMQSDIDAAASELAAAVADIDTAVEALACDDGVLCSFADTFATGQCRGGMVTSLSTLRLRGTLRDGALSADKDKILFKATLPLAELTSDPAQTGMTLELATGAAKTFFSGTIPAASFVDKQGRGRKFLFKDRLGLLSSANGVRKVLVKKNTKKAELFVKAKILGAETAAADGQSTLSLSLLFGSDPLSDDCLAGAFLSCSGKPGAGFRCSLP